jgi:hypothetical protein
MVPPAYRRILTLGRAGLRLATASPAADETFTGRQAWEISRKSTCGTLEAGITLRHVRWPMNNERGTFTRDSLVRSVLEREAEAVRTPACGWTEPGAERIGLNLQWLLVNCYLISNRDVRPAFD